MTQAGLEPDTYEDDLNQGTSMPSLHGTKDETQDFIHARQTLQNYNPAQLNCLRLKMVL